MFDRESPFGGDSAKGSHPGPGSRASSRRSSASNDDGSSKRKTSSTYITTGADEEEEDPDRVKLPKIHSNKMIFKPRISILGNQQFEPPRLATLHKANYFRISKLSKPKTLSTNRVVTRRQRRMQKDVSSGSESELEPSNRSFNTDKDDLHEFDDDFDFDGEDSMFIHHTDEKIENHCRVVYKKMCSKLNVMASNYFLRHLLTTEIIMKHSIIGVRGAKACCAALLENITVKTLHLEGNDLGSEGTRYIAELLAENMTITSLTVAENEIGNEGLIALKEVLKTNENIVKLDLSGNNLNEFDAVHIAEILEENTILKALILHHNAFREVGGVTLAKAILNNDSVEELDLGWNHLRRRGVTAIAESVARNLGITHLNVSWNGFYLDGCKAMAKALKENKTIEILDLTCNRIDFECLTELIKGLKCHTTLTTLKLSNNPITAAGAKCLLEMIETNKEIQIREIDIKTQCIDVPFLRIMDRIRDDERQIRVRHGIILDQTGSGDAADEQFMHEDPMMVLMECMRMMNLRLVDLFSSLDKDQSRSLTHDEFKKGLLSVHVPMSVEAIERLIKKLDTDGDGEVDYVELLEGQKTHQKKLRRLRTVESDLPYEETELGRISFKIKTLMTKRQAIMRARVEEERVQRAKDRLAIIGAANSFVRETTKSAGSRKVRTSKK